MMVASGRTMKGKCHACRPLQPFQTLRVANGTTKRRVTSATEPKRPKKRAMIWSSVYAVMHGGPWVALHARGLFHEISQPSKATTNAYQKGSE